MSYTKTIAAGELQPGMMRKITVEGRSILLVNLGGAFFALSNTCTHMGGSLADGVLEGDVVHCPRHHAGFEVKTGRCVVRPKILLFNGHAASLPTYPVKVEQGAVWVDTRQMPPPPMQPTAGQTARQ